MTESSFVMTEGMLTCGTYIALSADQGSCKFRFAGKKMRGADRLAIDGECNLLRSCRKNPSLDQHFRNGMGMKNPRSGLLAVGALGTYRAPGPCIVAEAIKEEVSGTAWGNPF